MIRTLKTVLLTAVTIAAAGCARSDFAVGPQNLANTGTLEGSRIAQAGEDMTTPLILPDTFLAAGQLHEASGMIGAAIVQYRKAIAVNHGFVGAYHRLALALSALGEHEEAARTFRRAVMLLPESAVLQNNLGYELMVLRRWTEAEPCFRRAIELEHDFARPYVNRGMVLSRLGRFEEAFECFLAVLPEADAYYNLGLMYRGQRRYTDAADAFHRVLTLNPGFVAAMTQLEQIEPELPPEPILTFAEPVDPDDSFVPPSDATEPEVVAFSDGPEMGPPAPASSLPTTEHETAFPMSAPFARTAANDGPPVLKNPEDRLEEIRNEIACWEDREVQRQTTMAGYAFATSTEWDEPNFCEDGDEETFFNGYTASVIIEPDEAFLWEALDVTELSFEQILRLFPPQLFPPQLPPTQRKTLGATVIQDDPDQADAAALRSCMEDDEVSSSDEDLYESQDLPCEDELEELDGDEASTELGDLDDEPSSEVGYGDAEAAIEWDDVEDEASIEVDTVDDGLASPELHVADASAAHPTHTAEKEPRIVSDEIHPMGMTGLVRLLAGEGPATLSPLPETVADPIAPLRDVMSVIENQILCAERRKTERVNLEPFGERYVRDGAEAAALSSFLDEDEVSDGARDETSPGEEITLELLTQALRGKLSRAWVRHHRVPWRDQDPLAPLGD